MRLLTTREIALLDEHGIGIHVVGTARRDAKGVWRLEDGREIPAAFTEQAVEAWLARLDAMESDIDRYVRLGWEYWKVHTDALGDELDNLWGRLTMEERQLASARIAALVVAERHVKP